ncbi:antibiotic biosynthesis monooxygenase family protein [Flavicella sediminum]|uniref:antibiotic biosynthesis monooxygenase family protein n=1 Tax=Flavicella sediminum TaxID=2585141 RepID=UPI00111FFCC3|nr:antibiotic biosynthesis monooxygenase [Flavicella sediminum]
MFVVIYSFKIKPGQNDRFLKCWSKLTRMIYQYENSLGSRIHKQSENTFIAYAQWPNSDTFHNSGNNLPEESIELRNKMRAACLEFKIIDKLELIEDQLASKTYH